MLAMAEFTQHELGQVLMMAQSDFQKRLDADLQVRGVQGIRARHRKVFMYLSSHGPSRSVDLAERVGVRPQSMMTTIHELEELDLVVRSTDPSDSRAKLVSLTSAGQTFLAELSRSTVTVWGQYAEHIGGKKMRAAMQVLQQMSALDNK